MVARDSRADGDGRLLAHRPREPARATRGSSRAERQAARIEFGAARRDDERAYFVRDNGAGFDMAYASKLFGAVPAAARGPRVPGDGGRPRDGAAHRPSSRRPHLGRGRGRRAARRSSSRFPAETGGDVHDQGHPARRGQRQRRGAHAPARFKKSGVANEVVVARDGAEALDYLFARAATPARDLSELPRSSSSISTCRSSTASTSCARIRADARTRLLPVVILTVVEAKTRTSSRSYAARRQQLRPQAGGLRRVRRGRAHARALLAAPERAAAELTFDFALSGGHGRAPRGRARPGPPGEGLLEERRAGRTLWRAWSLGSA